MHNVPTEIFIYINNKLANIKDLLYKKRLIISLLCILSFVFFYFILDFSSQSLVAHDEGLYARRARLIEESYNWFSPPFSAPHHKTIGSYWFIALSIRLFGSSELALRLPSIFASFLSLFSSYWIALKITNKKSALISIFSLSSMPLWIKYSRYASPDFPFVLCILLAILFFLVFLETKHDINKYIYIFISGLFLSTSFFIRSYMAFVPLIGLAPFLLYHLYSQKNIIKVIYCLGIFVGSIPTLLNLYFSYNKFGITGITSLFNFAKKQAIGSIDFNNILFIPLNYLYFTFPIGILLFILIVFTKSNAPIKYPLLVFCYPLLSLLILLSMSTSYPHYYLFLLPSLSILFATKLQFQLYRFSFSEINIRYILLFMIFAIIFALLYFLLFFDYSLIEYHYEKSFLVFLVSLLLILSYISSIRVLFKNKPSRIDLTKFFYHIVIPQYISLSLLFNFGILGNPNYKTKSFLTNSVVSSIINSNTVYLINVESKIQTLLSYYLPSSKIINTFDDLDMYQYIITSDSKMLNNLNEENVFKFIHKFDNHVLLMNISK